MTEQTEAKPSCKYCQSQDVVKFGTYHGAQRYWCKACQRKFKADNALFKGKVSAADVSSALNEYYSGMSINDIRRRIRQESGYYPAQSTVYQWVEKYTDKATKYYDQYKPSVGDVWTADETVLNIDGKDVWFWDIIDEDTRFLLASKMSYTRNMSDAKTLFELAKKRAGKEPKVLLTDKQTSYPQASRDILPDTVHKQTRPFVHTDSTNKIERWHSTLKERTKVMRGLKDTNSALAFTDGFLAYYNFIRPHESLDGQTPAERAGIQYDVKNWAGVIRMGEPATQSYMPPELNAARQTITGNPTKMGRKHGQRPAHYANPEAHYEYLVKDRVPNLQAKIPPEVKRIMNGGRMPKGMRY